VLNCLYLFQGMKLFNCLILSQDIKPNIKDEQYLFRIHNRWGLCQVARLVCTSQLGGNGSCATLTTVNAYLLDHGLKVRFYV
jgi:hypothetical protein